MQFARPILVLLLVPFVAACMETDGERALAGAAAGALIADATDNDVVTGAAIGGLGGVFCDDLNIPIPGCIQR
jgi:uncharacterized membrane protein AbrB (regulator of aidB expression)